MRCPRPAESSSSDNSDASDSESCFDTDGEGGTDSDTNPTDVDTNVDTDLEGEDELDVSWIIDEDKDHPPEYYLNQEKECDEAEDANEDYKDNSLALLDGIEERWHR
jgi:hypothetical protein